MKKGVMIAAAVGIAAALGFFAQRHFTDAPVAAAAIVPPPVSGLESADGTPADGDGPVIPETLPHFSLADVDGRMRSLHEWAGQPVMVNYWATWCAPCRREIPLLNELRAERQGERLEIVGIAVDFRDDVLEFAKDTAIDYPLLIGEEDGLAAVTAIGMQPAFPFTVFADSQQRIVALKVGELHRDEAELILDRVTAVDAGQLPLQRAREEIAEGLKELAAKRANAAAAEAASAAT